MRNLLLLLILIMGVVSWGAAVQAEVRISDDTQACLDCHDMVSPAIVADWKKSRHYEVSPAEAMKQAEQSRTISAEAVPEGLAETSVGCAECHTLSPELHRDTFEHEGQQVHPVVTPRDCAACHPVESGQYLRNKMALAHGNLTGNPLYHDLIGVINGIYTLEDGKLKMKSPDEETNAVSCLSCHGTKVEAKGTMMRTTDFGEMEFPILSGWPNQGVGRVNPDESLGSCAACHARHRFSLTMARQPYTCSQCHKGPDVLAYKIYEVSKHGNIFSTSKSEWDFTAVPWVVGEHFNAPTCAVCHVSALKDQGGALIAERTHQMNDRLPWRIFGLVYAHPQPKSADTTVIKNKGGLPLPTELTGGPALEYLISPEEMEQRTGKMQKVCQSCHSRDWVQGHWKFFKHTIDTTNEMTLTATKILMEAWEKGAVQGPAAGSSAFDEALERKWVEQWLFHANSTRLAAAMGGADYGVFDQGRWEMSKNLQDMLDWIQFKLLTREPKEKAVQ